MEVEYKGFTVKDDGTVINRFRNYVGFKHKNGYMYMSINGKRVPMHRFIWEAFNGEIPQRMEIDHINTIRDDNKLCNLRMVSSSENKKNPITIEHYKQSNKGKGKPKVEARKRIGQFTTDGKLICEYESGYALGKNGLSQSMICRCCNGYIPTYKNFIWRYM